MPMTDELPARPRPSYDCRLSPDLCSCRWLEAPWSFAVTRWVTLSLVLNHDVRLTFMYVTCLDTSFSTGVLITAMAHHYFVQISDGPMAGCCHFASGSGRSGHLAFLDFFSLLCFSCFVCNHRPKGVGKYAKSVEILKMLAAPPMGGKIWI